jgi:flagellar FliL protein
MSETQPEAEQPVARKKPRSKLLIISILVVVLLLGGGGAGAYWWMRVHAEGAEGDAAKEEEHAEPGMVSLEPFVVNLADTEARRYLRINVRFIVDGPEVAAELQENQVASMRLRAGVLELLTQQTAAGLQTAEGKATLKKSIAERASAIVKPAEVSDVLFSDFVVQ